MLVREIQLIKEARERAFENILKTPLTPSQRCIAWLTRMLWINVEI